MTTEKHITEPKDQSKRIHQIAILEFVIAKNATSIEITELCLKRQIEKQINRMAELRCQKMLLNMAERAALKAAKATPV
jgi:hypothetical protein